MAQVQVQNNHHPGKEAVMLKTWVTDRRRYFFHGHIFFLFWWNPFLWSINCMLFSVEARILLRLDLLKILCWLISSQVLAIEFGDGKDKLSQDLSISQTKSHRKEDGSSRLPVITAEQYAYRSALLSSLIIAWSPLLKSSSESHSGYELSSSSFSVLAVGGKSGAISFWRINMPKFYSVEDANVHPSVMFIWSLQAHNSWVTAISWLLLTADSSTPNVCLASGGSDGRWFAKGKWKSLF